MGSVKHSNDHIADQQVGRNRQKYVYKREKILMSVSDMIFVERLPDFTKKNDKTFKTVFIH